MKTIIIASLFFILIVTALILLLTWVRSKLVSEGEVTVHLLPDGSRDIRVIPGETLLNALVGHGVYLPSSCGGKGTCATCKCRVLDGGGEPLPTEQGVLSPKMLRRGMRLACQLKVRQEMALELPEGLLDVRHYACRVRSNRNLTATMKELVLELPENAPFSFKAGGYIQISCEPQTIDYADIPIDEKYEPVWKAQHWRELKAEIAEPLTRAYSMANYPDEAGLVILNIRLATPPKAGVPTGKMSSYLFHLKEGDTVDVSGPFGDFFVQSKDCELCFIGGGAGMAPMRSHIFDQLKRLNTGRKITFWYGARDLSQAFYVDEFDELARLHPNFSWKLALSNAEPDDPEDIPRGFVHEVLFAQYIKDHPCPEAVEYYLCGPPRMLQACCKMLDENGVDADHIFYDDFGS